MNVCTCPAEGIDPNCPWAREGLGHVKACPVSQEPCPCLSGSVSEAHCYVNANPDWADGLKL